MFEKNIFVDFWKKQLFSNQKAQKRESKAIQNLNSVRFSNEWIRGTSRPLIDYQMGHNFENLAKSFA